MNHVWHFWGVEARPVLRCLLIIISQVTTDLTDQSKSIYAASFICSKKIAAAVYCLQCIQSHAILSNYHCFPFFLLLNNSINGNEDNNIRVLLRILLLASAAPCSSNTNTNSNTTVSYTHLTLPTKRIV